MGVETVNEEEQDQGYFAEPGKPPSKPTYVLLFFKSSFVFKNKIMHVSFSSVTPCHPNFFFKNIV